MDLTILRHDGGRRFLVATVETGRGPLFHGALELPDDAAYEALPRRQDGTIVFRPDDLAFVEAHRQELTLESRITRGCIPTSKRRQE